MEKYKVLLDNTCKSFNLDLEHELYSKIVYKNVNNYLAVTEDGKFKQKGLFVINPVLANSTDTLVIAKALEAYYTRDISPTEFISNPAKYNLHIYDYCKSNKIGKEFKVYHDSKVQQQLNRYYFSKNAPYLFKQKHGVGTMQHINVGEGVKLFNNYINLSWDKYEINYNYYIAATQKIINEINNNGQLTLF